MNKNYLENKLFSIYSSIHNMPQIEFKKINETDYLFGTLKITINIDFKNPNNLTGKFIF